MLFDFLRTNFLGLVVEIQKLVLRDLIFPRVQVADHIIMFYGKVVIERRKNKAIRILFTDVINQEGFDLSLERVFIVHFADNSTVILKHA